MGGVLNLNFGSLYKMPLFETPRKEGMCLRPEQLFEKAEVRGGEEAPSQALILGAVTVTP